MVERWPPLQWVNTRPIPKRKLAFFTALAHAREPPAILTLQPPVVSVRPTEMEFPLYFHTLGREP